MRESHIKKAGGHYIKTKLKEKYQKNNFFSLHNIKNPNLFFYTKSSTILLRGTPIHLRKRIDSHQTDTPKQKP
jgi:hypothetical protein